MTILCSRVEIRLGDWDLLQENDCEMGESGEMCAPPFIRVSMETAVIHPNYGRRFQYSDDVALIRLTESLNLDELSRKFSSEFFQNFFFDVTFFFLLILNMACEDNGIFIRSQRPSILYVYLLHSPPV